MALPELVITVILLEPVVAVVVLILPEAMVVAVADE
jgi:hypothetical protein